MIDAFFRILIGVIFGVILMKLERTSIKKNYCSHTFELHKDVEKCRDEAFPWEVGE